MPLFQKVAAYFSAGGATETDSTAEPQTTPTERLVNARKVSAARDRLEDAVRIARVTAERLCAFAHDARHSPKVRANYRSSDLNRFDVEADAALVQHGEALNALAEFEGEHGNAQTLRDLTSSIESDIRQARKTELVEWQRENLRKQLNHGDALAELQLEFYAKYDQAALDFPSDNPLRVVGLAPDFSYDREFRQKVNSRTTWGAAKTSICCFFPELLRENDPLTNAVRQEREKWGFDRMA